MSDPDVVAELDRWLKGDPSPSSSIFKRARDEIVALRSVALGRYHDVDVVIGTYQRARAEALEEAARVCLETSESTLPTAGTEEIWRSACEVCFVAIRALKDKRDE